MDWWQIFLALMVGCLVMLFVANEYQKHEKRKNRQIQQRTEVTLMANRNEEEWEPVNDDGHLKRRKTTAQELLREEKVQDLAPLGEPEEKDDLNKPFIVKSLEITNRRINQYFAKKDVKDKLEIEQTQTERLSNRNKAADAEIEYRTKGQEHQLNQLRYNERLERRTRFKEKRMQDRELDYDISIAEKQAKLDAIKNPPTPEVPAAPRSLSQEIASLEIKIKDEENLMKARIFEITQGRQFKDLPEEDQERVLFIENHHQEHLQKMYRKLNDLRSKQI